MRNFENFYELNKAKKLLGFARASRAYGTSSILLLLYQYYVILRTPVGINKKQMDARRVKARGGVVVVTVDSAAVCGRRARPGSMCCRPPVACGPWVRLASCCSSRVCVHGLV